MLIFEIHVLRFVFILFEYLSLLDLNGISEFC